MEKPTPSPPTEAAAVPLGPDTDLTGKTLSDFQVLRRLGAGGMGQVYLAEQLSLKRRVALKIMRAELAANPVYLQRFRTEAEAAARMTHANIVQVYAIGESHGLHYMALEYVDGRNLREYLSKKGPPDLPVALSIMRQVAAALQRASEMGIVHRDIKPDNILLTRKGEVKVADFGLVRWFTSDHQPLNLTQSGVTLGTPLYMSPEQVQGKDLDPRSDIYSFGVTCYHMLTGQPPFRGATAFEVTLQHVQAEAEPLHKVRPDLPANLCAVVHKMMAKAPEARFQTGRDLLKELTRLRESMPTVTVGMLPPSAVTDPEKSGVLESTGPLELTPTKSVATVAVAVSRKRLRLWLAATLALALLAGAAAALVLRQHNPGEPAAAVPGGGSPAIGATAAASAAAEQERFLVRQFAEYTNPKEEKRLTYGVAACLQLSAFYLEHNDLAKAEQFFTKLTNDPHKVKPYLAVGSLGQAVVLSARGEAARSNQLFLEGIQTLEGSKYFDFILNLESPLRSWVARAVERNVAQGPVPAGLEFLRRPPAPVKPQPRPAGGEKALGKGLGR
jgi:serine/threonine-protein kinase